MLVEQQEGNRVMGLRVPEEVLQIHGVAPASKLEGVIRLIYDMQMGSATSSAITKRWRRQKRSMTN